MPTDEMQDVQREIATQTRIRDEVPERIPTTLARELANHYPADVQRHSDRLASLAAELLRRERQAGAEERHARYRESRELRARIEHLQNTATAAEERSGALERQAADDVLELRRHLAAIVERVRRFRKRSQASKGSLLADVVRMAESCSSTLAAR